VLRALALGTVFLSHACLQQSARAASQFSVSFDNQPKPQSYVVYAAEPQAVPTGRQAILDLSFHVLNGFHVNSHTPSSEFLIPTRLDLQPAPGVSPGALVYPPGKLYTLPADPTEKLDVYTGDFHVKLPVLASPGPHELKALLKYQACDNAACYPPKTLSIAILFTAK
jgi:hypothetical protein